MLRRTLLVLILALHADLLFAQEDPAIVAATERFELRSDTRVTLHHFLLAWAAADDGSWPPYALPVAEREYWRALLDNEEERAWAAAIEAYAASRGRNVVFDPGLIAVRDWAAGVAAREAIPAADRRLAEALDGALPVYRRHWWPAHDTGNRAWIESVAPMLRTIEDDVVPRVEAAYGGRWPDAPIPIDATVYSNPVGAYSTGGRVTISSTASSSRMPQALELVFHEASHLDALESRLRKALDGAFHAVGGEAPEGLWHDTIFFTTGALTRIVLAEHGQPGYRHYGEAGVYRRGERWAVQLPLFEQYWQPFLEAASADAEARDAALQAIAEALR